MGRLRNIGRLRAAPVGGVDSDAAAWAAAVTANGGTYSGTTLAAVSAFAVSAKASGYWTKLNRINLFCGNQLAAALVPLKVGGGSATETNSNFVAGDYTEATGLTGNGTTKFLDTGLAPSVSLTLNDTHLAVYNRSSTAASGGGSIGSNDATSMFRTYAPFTTGSLISDQYDGTAGQGRTSSAALSTPYGFLVATRTASNAHDLYRNGASAAATSTTTGGALTARTVYVFAHNNTGAAVSFISQPLSAYSIGSGLTAADVTAYNTHMQTFQTSLARNV